MECPKWSKDEGKYVFEQKKIRKAIKDHRFNDVMDLAYRINNAKTRKEWKQLGKELKIMGNYFTYEAHSERRFESYQDEDN